MKQCEGNIINEAGVEAMAWLYEALNSHNHDAKQSRAACLLCMDWLSTEQQAVIITAILQT